MDGGEMGSHEAARRGSRTGGSSKLLEKTRRQPGVPYTRPDGDTLDLIVAWPQADLHHARVRVPYTTR
jgi:hypothetical protein